MLPAWWLPFACFTSSSPQNPIPCTPLLVSLLWFKIWNSRSGRTRLSLHFGWRFRISALSPGLRAGQVLHPQITLQPEAELVPAATAPDDLPTLLVWPESWANLLRDYMCPIPTAWPRAAIPWISCHIFHWIPSTHTLGTCLGTLLMYKSGDMTISFFFHILKTQGYFPISSITKISPFSIDPCMRHMKGHRFPFPSLQCVCLCLMCWEKMTLSSFLQRTWHKGPRNAPTKYVLIMKSIGHSDRSLPDESQVLQTFIFTWMRQNKRNSQEKCSYWLVKKNELNHN